MFKIEDTTIHLTKGDKAVIGLSIEDYTFQPGDHIEFRIYAKRSLDKMPLIIIEKTVLEETTEVDITLLPEDTKICTVLNSPIIYWYEIELNNEYTVIGYDEDGAKELILYPEGVEETDANS